MFTFLALQAMMERRLNKLEQDLGGKISNQDDKLSKLDQDLLKLRTQLKTGASLAVVAISVVGLCLRYF